MRKIMGYTINLSGCIQLDKVIVSNKLVKLVAGALD